MIPTFEILFISFFYFLEFIIKANDILFLFILHIKYQIKFSFENKIYILKKITYKKLF
jgi:hypothetical protein